MWIDCNVQFIEVDVYKVVRYAIDTMKWMLAWKADVEKDVEASIFWNDDADVADPQAIPAIAQELVSWLGRPKRISATERK